MRALFTLGYEGLTPERCFDTIQAASAETLVDVRLTRLSRKPDFSKNDAYGDGGRPEGRHTIIWSISEPRAM